MDFRVVMALFFEIPVFFNHPVCTHLDRLKELPPPVPDEPHHDLVVPLVVGPVGLVARGDVPRDHAARPRKP